MVSPARRRLWFFALGETPELVYGSMLERIGAGGVETTYIELPKALQALGQECFVFCRCEAEHVVDGVRFVPWERMPEYCDLGPDVVVASRWFEPLTWPALAGAKKVLWLQDAYFADPGRAFEIVDRVVVSSPWHRNYTVQRYGHGIDAGKLRVINLGIGASCLLEMLRESWTLRVADRCRWCIRAIRIEAPGAGCDVAGDCRCTSSVQWPGLRLVVTYGWEGLRTWDTSPAWQERCDQVEAEVRGASLVKT